MIIIIVTVLLCVDVPKHARAHPADMYIQSQAVAVAWDQLRIDWKILPGPFLADAVWESSHSASDGSFDAQAAKAWLAPYLAGLSIMVDGWPLVGTHVEKMQWPDSVDALRTGEAAIQISLQAGWSGRLRGTHSIEIHNSYLEGNSLNTFSLTSAVGMSFQRPTQNNGRLQFEAYFPSPGTIPPTGPDWLTSWSSSTPNLPVGFAHTISSAAATLNGSPLKSSLPNPNAVTAVLTNLVRANQFSPWFLIGAFFLSMALGSLHALTPGHGKALVGTYLVGSHGTNQDAMLLGSIVTITHTGSVLVLGFVILLASRYILPTVILPWLEVISGLLVIAFGISLFRQRRRDIAIERYELATHDHHDEHDRHRHEHMHPHESSGELHNTAPTTKSLFLLGVSGGLVPCPDAIAILLVAVAVNRIPFGMLLIVAFSVGLALVLILIGLAMVHGVGWILQNNRVARFGKHAPLISSMVVCALGFGLTLNAVNSFRLESLVYPVKAASPTQTLATSPAFDLQNARILYIALDKVGTDQLFLLSSSNGGSIQYTDDPSGVTEYSLSPDGETILYVVYGLPTGTSIWAMNADSSQKRRILDCPQAECDAPVWYPDGQKVAYERLDSSQDLAAVPRFSIWWLDLETGRTQPIFQDADYASTAPAFSSDGQWLSFIDAANNELVACNLKDGSQRSIPLGSQGYFPEMWSPRGDTLLFGSATISNARLSNRSKIYSLSSGITTELGPAGNQTDIAATWSPDGEWIAVDRSVPSSDVYGNRNQVWIVKSDASESRLLLSETGATYSHLRWSPDGSYLLYSRYMLQQSGQSRGRFDVYAANIQTGRATLLVSGGDLATFLP
ncbi:MAG TPA: sulfite exporter TauE/SafE family protein [Anaerolineales bacterium]|nr:sulfite exporter TauE/SafE family protein [Anaerolineales bacterium]